MFKIQMMMIFDTYQQFALESNPHPAIKEIEKFKNTEEKNDN